jgi:alpha-L-arabinofuranosidase
MKWADMVAYLKATHSEPLMIANIMTLDVQNCLDWIADAKTQGLTVRYVELGNEPDYEAELGHNGETQFWTVIDNYCQAYLQFAKAIKAKYPDIKLMGPTVAQVENHERKAGQPWLASQTDPWWVEKFLEECGPYVDVVSVHSYPYWVNDSELNLMTKTNHWAEFVPKIREAIQKNVPDRANQIEIAVSEWNSGDENPTTAKIVNGVFCADYLAQMALWGISQSNIWDMMTQKPGQGGGHGVIDPNNDTEHPFALRSTYWALDLMEHHFGTELYQAVTDNDDLSAYASKGGGKNYLMIINKNPKYAYSAKINLGSNEQGKSKLDFYRLSPSEFQWSENLYRAVINSGPSHLMGSTTVKSRFSATFPPYSVTCIEMTPAH